MREKPLQEESSRWRTRTGATHSGETLAWWEDAQTEGQQDPATQEAVATEVVLQLLADLTVDLVSDRRKCFMEVLHLTLL